MALIDELKERRQRALDEAQTLTAQWFDLDERRLKLCQIAADCDTAIAALEPPPAAVMSDDTRERIADFKNKYPGFQAEQETAPAVVTEPELDPEPHDDGHGLQEWVKPSSFYKPAPLIEAEPLADPIWNEPEPTKPEADSIAKALDHYDPKAMAERERFNPFNIFKREGDQ